MSKKEWLFKKGNKAAAKKKGKKHPKTIIKEKIKNWEDEANELVEKNILEFLESKDKKTRMLATKYFAEYIKPKKKEISGEITNNNNYNHKVFVIPSFKDEEVKEVKKIEAYNETQEAEIIENQAEKIHAEKK